MHDPNAPNAPNAPQDPAQEVTLAPATAADLDDLLALVRAYYAYDGIDFDAPKQRAALRGLLNAPAHGESLFILRGGERVGYAVMTLDYSIEFGGLEAFIDELFLVEHARGGGVGGAAVALLKGWCRARGVRSLSVIVEHHNAPALRFYARHGWGTPHRHVLAQPI